MEKNPENILDEIQIIVLNQQNEFNRIWQQILKEMQSQNIFLVDEKHLANDQQEFVKKFFEEKVRSNIIPFMIENLPQLALPARKKYLSRCCNAETRNGLQQKYALIEMPSHIVGRFILLPAPEGEQHIILLEDIIRFNLPYIFSYFNYATL